jgi:hypothetical protein
MQRRTLLLTTGCCVWIGLYAFLYIAFEEFNFVLVSKEERKAQLRAAAQDMKQTGKTEQVFEDSQYSVSEDKTPNIHTRVSAAKYCWVRYACTLFQ